MQYTIDLDDNEIFLIQFLIGAKQQELAVMARSGSTDPMCKARRESARRLRAKYRALEDSIADQVFMQRGGGNH